MNYSADINVATDRNFRNSPRNRILSRSGHTQSVQIIKSKRHMGKKFISVPTTLCRSRWPRGLSRGSAAARWLELRV
jgi:hypothetical protein